MCGFLPDFRVLEYVDIGVHASEGLLIEFGGGDVHTEQGFLGINAPVKS